jgi:hypothetical protein
MKHRNDYASPESSHTASQNESPSVCKILMYISRKQSRNFEAEQRKNVLNQTKEPVFNLINKKNDALDLRAVQLLYYLKCTNLNLNRLQLSKYGAMKPRFIYFGHLNHVRQCRRFFCFYRSVIVVDGSPVVFEVVFDPSFANVKESEQSPISIVSTPESHLRYSDTSDDHARCLAHYFLSYSLPRKHARLDSIQKEG